MKRNRCVMLLLFGFVSQLQFSASAEKLPFADRYAETLRHSPESERRLDRWFRDAKFGAFIHFGAYSPLAGIYKERVLGGPYAEWIQMGLRIPYPEYRKDVVGAFNPQDFDADEWVKTFKDAGMRYVVITSKHHDGFALFDSAVSDYDVMDASPFKRDIIGELSEACQREGLRFGVYYSQAFDWSEPDAPFDLRPIMDLHPDLTEDAVRDMDRYLEEKAFPQVEELMKNYEIDLIWFDTPAGMTPARARKFRDLVRKYRPDCLINSRLIHWPTHVLEEEHLALFDYVSLEDKEVPPTRIALTTESPDSVSTSYGYKLHGPVTYHSEKELMERFVHTVCGGGNYLLNSGPMGNGKLDPEAVKRFAAMGEWLRDNHASIYDTEANPLPSRPEWGDASLSKDGETLYLHVMQWPANGKLRVEGVPVNAVSATFLAPKAAEQKILLSQEGSTLLLDLPSTAIDEYDSVIKLALQSPFPVGGSKSCLPESRR